MKELKTRNGAIREAHKEGKTCAAIAEEYGITRGRVQQIISYRPPDIPYGKRLDNIVFPTIVKYCKENKLNMWGFITLCVRGNRKEQQNMRNYLVGKTKPQYKYAKIVSNVTGIDIETLMGDE